MQSALVQWTLGYLVGVVFGDALGCRAATGQWLAGVALSGLLLAAWRRGAWHLGLPIAAAALGLWAQAQAVAPASWLPERPHESPAWGSARPLAEPWRLQGIVCGDVRSTASGVQLQLVPQALEPLVAGPAASDLSSVAPAGLLPAPWLVRIQGRPKEPIWPGDHLGLAVPARALQALGVDEPRPRRATSATSDSAALSVFADAVLRIADEAAPATVSQPRRDPWNLAQATCPQPIGLLRQMVRARAALLSAWQRAWLQLPAWARGRDDAAASAFVQALTLGERSALRRVDIQRSQRGWPAIEAQIKESGVYHILSVSGLHMSAVGLVFFGLASRLLRRVQGHWAHTRWAAMMIAQRWAAVATLPIVIAYALISGAEPPAVRAAMALGLWLLGQICARRGRLREGLALAVLWAGLPIGADRGPAQLFSPSLVLSFAATLGIAYLRPLRLLLPRLWSAMRKAQATSVDPHPGRGPRIAVPLADGLLRLLDGSLAALLTTLPLLAYYFSQIQGASLLGNFAITPIAELVTLPCGLLAALTAALWPPLSLPFALVAALSTRAVLWLSQVLAGWDLSLAVAAPCLLFVAIWFAGLLLLRSRPAWALGLLTATVVAQGLVTGLPARSLRLTFLDVGQGDAAVAELPTGEVIVIDAGRPALRVASPDDDAGKDTAPVISSDSGQAVVAPFLRRHGHRRIDLLIVSHRHPDHMGGVLSLLQQFQVDVLWLARPPAVPYAGSDDRDETDPLAQAEAEVLKQARQRGTLVAVPHALTWSGVQIDVLSPCSSTKRCRAQARSDWHENDNSLVVALRYAGRSVLMTGDIEADAEATLCQQQPPASLRAEVLKLPHHGSRTSSSLALLQAVRPQVAIASLGRHNRFGFPHPEPVSRLRRLQIPLLRTDQLGAIQIEIPADGRLHVTSQASAPPWSAWLPGRWMP